MHRLTQAFSSLFTPDNAVDSLLDELTIYDSPDATANFASGAAGSSSAFQIAGMMEQVAALHEKIHKGRDWDQVAGAIVAPGGPFGEGSAADASDESLAKLVGLNYLGCLLIIVLIYGSMIKFLARLPVRDFFRGIVDAMAVSYSTASSNATLPVTLRCAAVAPEQMSMQAR